MVRWGRAFVAVGLLMVSVLAGCSSSGGDKQTSSSTSSSTGPAPVKAIISWHAKDAKAAPGNATNKTSNATAVASALTIGQVAVFDAANSTGAIVTYAWSFGDNGTSANKRVEHAFATAGSFNVTLKVSSLQNATSNATVRIEVKASPKGQFLFKAHQDFDGDLPVMNPNSCTNQGVDCNDHPVPVVDKDANGTAALAKHVFINVTGSSSIPAGDMQVFWKSPDGTTLAQTAASGQSFSFDYAGDMPAGDYILRVRLFTGAQVSYTATVDVVYVGA